MMTTHKNGCNALEALDLIDRQAAIADVVRCKNCGHRVAERPFEVYCNIMCKWVLEKDYCTMFEPGRMEEVSKISFDIEKLKKDIGYDGCRNCKNQIEPLRMCEWMEHDGDGHVHVPSFICRKWERRDDGVK